MAVIKVSVFAGSDQRELDIQTDFPLSRRSAEETFSVIIAVDPTNWIDVMNLAWGRKVEQYTWRLGNETHDFFFVTPRVRRNHLHVTKTTEEWRSTSLGSVSLYPWWVNVPMAGADLICQIHPQGCSSYHYHAPEEGVAVAEIYWPILNDGFTMLRVNGQKPRPLVQRWNILPNQEHQLVRDRPGFSIQLLVMNSRKYRFPCKDGHCRRD